MNWLVDNERVTPDAPATEDPVVPLWRGTRMLGAAYGLDCVQQIVIHWPHDTQTDIIESRHIHRQLTAELVETAAIEMLRRVQSVSAAKRAQSLVCQDGLFYAQLTRERVYLGGVTVLPQWSPQQTFLVVDQKDQWHVLLSPFFWSRPAADVISDIAWFERLVGQEDLPLWNYFVPDWGERYSELRPMALAYFGNAQPGVWEKLSYVAKTYYLVRAHQALIDPWRS